MKPAFYRFRKNRLLDTEQVVQSGLAITPPQMMELTKEGAPISPQSLQGTYTDTSGEPPLMHRRGVDIADLWNAEKDGASTIKTAVKRKKIIDDLEAAAAASSVEPSKSE